MLSYAEKSSWLNRIFLLEMIINKKVIYLINIRNKIVRFFYFYFFHSLEFGKNVILEISGQRLIGQNDSVGVLLLVDTCIKYNKGRNELTDIFGG